MISSDFSLRRYIVFETCLTVLINIGFAIAAAVITFHGERWIYVSGRHGLVIDAIPQTFMGVLMTVLALLLITGLRLERGKFGEVKPRLALRHVIGIALLSAVACTLLCVGLLALTLPRIDLGGMSYVAMLGFKTVYSAALAAIITPLVLLMIFRGRARPRLS